MKAFLYYLRAIHPPIVLVLIGVGLSYLAFVHVHYLLGFLLSFLTVIAFSDGVNRFLEFKDVQKLIHLNITHESIERLLKRSKRTWCTRELMKAALASKLPKKRFDTYRNYYHQKGYNVFRIFPDGTFSKDSPWLTKAFYFKTFFRFLKNKKVKK